MFVSTDRLQRVDEDIAAFLLVLVPGDVRASGKLRRVFLIRFEGLTKPEKLLSLPMVRELLRSRGLLRGITVGSKKSSPRKSEGQK